MDPLLPKINICGIIPKIKKKQRPEIASFNKFLTVNFTVIYLSL